MKVFAKLTCALLLVAFIAVMSESSLAQSPRYPAKLCSSCGFGQKSEKCVKCDRWVGSTVIYARLCSSCGFGSKKDNCVKCGRWVGSTNIRARLCSSCGFGQKKENCVKCGKWSSQ